MNTTQKIKYLSPFQIEGRIKIITLRAGTKEVLRETPWVKNMIMLGANTGKSLILNRLAGDNTYSLNILHADIGTGTTAPDPSDTQLVAAVARANNPVAVVVSNDASLQFFWADAVLANGAYHEVATYVDGTDDVVNTGQIFNRALFASTYNKASNEDTIVQVDFIIS